MPAITPGDLVQAIVSAIQESGYSSVLLTPARSHPRHFAIAGAQEDRTFVLWVYAWTLTFGGRPSLPNEFRIQMTTVSSPLALNPAGPTVLIGYEPNENLFAGFDLVRHREFTEGSASVQIDIRTVREALQNGFAFSRKTNSEIAVGFRPDQFVNYAMNAIELHRVGAQPRIFELLNRASALEDISDIDITSLSTQRRRIVQTVSRLSRSSNFKQQVLFAYGNRCAVTKTQLRLVDAAHILPVGAPDSIDDVRNGLALAPTYHRAYDHGLIYLDEGYRMRINRERVHELAGLNLNGGLENFKSHLGKILLPPDRRQWPNKGMIRQANKHRRIAL